MDNKYDAVMQRIQYRHVVDEPPVVTEDMLRAFEDDIGYQLPADYRHFLSKYGYGSGRGGVYFPFAGVAKDDGAGVGVFYGLGLDNAYNLRKIRHVFLDRPDTVGPARLLPDSMLTIASSPGGQICLALTGQRQGSVSWWPSEGFADDTDYDAAEPENNLTYLASDFDSFINSLRRLDRKL